MQKQFEQEFSGASQVSLAEITAWLGDEKNIGATPHAQRSVAQFKVRLKPQTICLSIIELIDELEEILATPVQAAVKRVDEQEFARLNAQNLMFCEDAVRKIKKYFDGNSIIADYFVRVSHGESLHPHDAVAKTVKGIEGGFRIDGFEVASRGNRI